MRKTFVRCSTHGRVRAATTTETEFKMFSSGHRWSREKTVVVKTSSGLVKCSECGETGSPVVVNGTTNEGVACDARCTDATGTRCECECGGDNHGSAA